jgi:hypothetical protein
MEKASREMKFEAPTTLKDVRCICGHVVYAKCEAGDEEAIRENCAKKLCPDCAEGLKTAQAAWVEMAKEMGEDTEEIAKPKTGIWLPDHYT